MEKTFLFLQELLKDTTGIPLSRIADNKADLIGFLQRQTGYILSTFFLENTALYHYISDSNKQTDAICEWIAPGDIVFLLYADFAQNQIFILGPVLTQSFSRERTIQMLEHLGIPAKPKSSFLEFCSALPVTQSHILYRAGELVIGHLTGKNQSMQIIQAEIPEPESIPLQSAFSPDSDIVQMRQVENRYEHSAALTDAVRQGNLSLALHMIGRYDPDTQTPVRNTNPLRNAQNYCIVLNTQLRHAMENAGIHPFQVDRLSNEIGLEIEQLKNTKQLPGFFQSVIRRYCRLVQEYAYPDLKPLTHLAVTYIKEHLTDNLTVKDTAKALTVNANYLSTLFHWDMGMTFIDFVNKERTQQAAALLHHTNLQIQQIASTVGYNNTSYFTKQFLRFHGITPSHYRRERL